MFRTALAVAAIAIGVTAVAAQSDPIAARKAMMKKVGEQTKVGAGMAKGEAPYDQAKAQAIFATYVEASGTMPALFPENSKTGGETAALPAIWTNMDDVKGNSPSSARTPRPHRRP
jgi:cytochrome c556